MLPFKPEQNIQLLLLYAACIVIPFALLCFILMFVGTKGMHDVVGRMPFFSFLTKRQ